MKLLYLPYLHEYYITNELVLIIAMGGLLKRDIY